MTSGAVLQSNQLSSINCCVAAALLPPRVAPTSAHKMAELADDALADMRRENKIEQKASRRKLQQKLNAISSSTQRALQGMRQRRREIEHSIVTVSKLLESVATVKRERNFEEALPSIAAECDGVFAQLGSPGQHGSPARRQGDHGSGLLPQVAGARALEAAGTRGGGAPARHQRPHALDVLQDALDERGLGFDALMVACDAGKNGIFAPSQLHDAFAQLRLGLSRRDISKVVSLLHSAAGGGHASEALCLFDLRREMQRRERLRKRRAAAAGPGDSGSGRKRGDGGRRRRRRRAKRSPAGVPRGMAPQHRSPAERRADAGSSPESSAARRPGRGGARAEREGGSLGQQGGTADEGIESRLEQLAQTAALLEETGRPEEAEPYREEILAARDEMLGPSHPDTLVAANNLALVLSEQGKLDEAEPLYRGALAGFEKVLGPNHPSALTLLNNIAMLLREQDRFLEAEPFLRRALAGSEQALGPHHQHTLQVTHCPRARHICPRAFPVALRWLMACPDPTLALLRSASPLFVARLSTIWPLCFMTAGSSRRPSLCFARHLMRIAVSWATHTQTRTWYNSALRIWFAAILLTNALPPRAFLPCGCCFMNQLANNLADLLRDLNKFDEAEMLMRVVLSGLEDILGADHPNTKIACENLEDLLDARRAQEPRQRPQSQ